MDIKSYILKFSFNLIQTGCEKRNDPCYICNDTKTIKYYICACCDHMFCYQCIQIFEDNTKKSLLKDKREIICWCPCTTLNQKNKENFIMLYPFFEDYKLFKKCYTPNDYKLMLKFYY